MVANVFQVVFNILLLLCGCHGVASGCQCIAMWLPRCSESIFSMLLLYVIAEAL